MNAESAVNESSKQVENKKKKKKKKKKQRKMEKESLLGALLGPLCEVWNVRAPC